ncbi:MAG: class I SAM-dependent methyltransferase [Nitrososphaerota archaeon]|nr:class I SAM-dependent methyltransferase [Nitrososphaerota archaeon]MDG7024168.1 class I SAM-dependent methyltransferase [Nitrososphaerota archaeon]
MAKKEEPPAMEGCTTPCGNDRRIPVFVTDNVLRRLLSPPERLVEKYVEQGQVVGDLGSGPGFYSLPMAERVGKSGKVYAVDFDPRAIEALKARAERRGLDGTVEPHACSAAEIDFIPSGSVDFILANGLLCCMVDHAGAVREMKRVLKPQGRAHLTVSKTVRRKDSRAVTKEEWEKILGEFEVLERGEGLANRWAYVSLKTRP